MRKRKVHLQHNIIRAACGHDLFWDSPAWETHTKDASSVTCLRCKRTKAYREAVEKEKRNEPQTA